MGDDKIVFNGIPQFNGIGLDEWQFRVQMHMESNGLMEVLTSDPPENEPSKVSFASRDKKAMERLVALVHNDCLGYIREKRTAKEMWNGLQDVFAKKASS